MAPFLGIKAIDLLLTAVGLAMNNGPRRGRGPGTEERDLHMFGHLRPALASLRCWSLVTGVAYPLTAL